MTCGRFPVVAWAPFAIEPSRAIIPFIAGSRTVPANGGSQLDCALSGEREFSSLTVHDLFVSSQSADMFRQTFAVVDRRRCVVADVNGDGSATRCVSGYAGP